MKHILETQELEDFSQAYKPELNYLGDILFPNRKYDSFQFAWEIIAGKDLLPVAAEVSALDAEAPIRQRPDAKRITAETMLIKHKINLTEHANRVKNHGVGSDKVKEVIFDDVDNLYRGVRARVEAMKMELLANGYVTVKENNINKVVDYEYPTANIFITDLTNPSADVIELVEKVKTAAKANGKEITYAICSSRTINLLFKNTGLVTLWKNSSLVIPAPTKSAFKAFLEGLFEMQIIEYNEQYRYEKADGSYGQSRFYPEDRITFVAGEAGAELGVSAFAPTPEEEMLEDSVVLDGYAVATLWDEKDPAAQWTKVSAENLPIVKDVDSFYIVYTE